VFNIDSVSGSSVSIIAGGSQSVSAGDDVVLNYSFANDKALQVNFNVGDFLTAWVNGNSGLFTIINASVNITGLSTGGAPLSLFRANETNGSAHLGAVFSNVMPTGSSLTIVSMAASFHVVDILNGTQSFQPWFQVAATGGSVLAVAAPATSVPEPTMLSLLGVGLAGMLVARRRKSLTPAP
jgi:hypothetical protein